MKKIIILIGLLFLVMIGIISVYLWRNRSVSKITLDINPSIEIRLDKHKKVKRVLAINEDAKDLVKLNYRVKTLEETLTIIIQVLLEKEVINTDDLLCVIIHSEGEIQNKYVKDKLFRSVEKQDLALNVIEIQKITKEDKKLAKKYHISPAKAAYINSFTEVDAETLIHKSVNELNESMNSGNYCEEDYVLHGGHCYKEIKRIKSQSGKVCPEGYVDIEGVCYKEGRFIEKENYVCSNESELVGQLCVHKHISDPKGKCASGRYDSYYQKCIVQ